MARRSQWWRSPTCTRILLLIGLLLMWEVLSRLGVLDPFFFSSPTGVIGGARDLAGLADVRHALRVTGTAIALGFLIGVVLGLLAGLALGLSSLLRDAYFGTVLLVMSSPKVIFIPIFLSVFGVSHTAMAFGAFEAFFYVTTNVVGGVDLVEERHRRIGYAYRGTPWLTFTEIILPAAAPGVFAGVWYGLKNAFTGVMIVELYISAGGLGQIVKQYTNLLETDKVFALLIFVSIAAILAGVASARIEARVGRWREGRNFVRTT